MSEYGRSDIGPNMFTQRRTNTNQNTLQSAHFDDLFAQNIVLTLDKVIRKEQRMQHTEKALQWKTLYYKVYYFKYIALYVYMLMVVFEMPSWCLNNPHIKDRTT